MNVATIYLDSNLQQEIPITSSLLVADTNFPGAPFDIRQMRAAILAPKTNLYLYTQPNFQGNIVPVVTPTPSTGSQINRDTLPSILNNPGTVYISIGPSTEIQTRWQADQSGIYYNIKDATSLQAIRSFRLELPSTRITGTGQDVSIQDLSGQQTIGPGTAGDTSTPTATATPAGSDTTTPTAGGSRGFPVWGWILLVLGILLLIGIVIGAIMWFSRRSARNQIKLTV